jgi:hypothetical protein
VLRFAPPPSLLQRRPAVASFAAYPATGRVLPAVGYSARQLRDLAETINRARVDVVIVGTPVDLTRVIRIKHDTVRVRYGLAEASRPGLERVLDDFVRRQQPRRGHTVVRRTLKPAARRSAARGGTRGTASRGGAPKTASRGAAKKKLRHR